MGGIIFILILIIIIVIAIRYGRRTATTPTVAVVTGMDEVAEPTVIPVDDGYQSESL
jgi:hypothetical protein